MNIIKNFNKNNKDLKKNNRNKNLNSSDVFLSVLEELSNIKAKYLTILKKEKQRNRDV